MKSYIGITDYDWYRLLADRPDLDEVNFWQPSGRREFRTLQPGDLFVFKLHAPLNAVVGGGFFAHATRLQVSLAWDAFGEKNGALSLQEMRSRIKKYRKNSSRLHEDYVIGCILLEQPFFLPEPLWVPAPPDWKPNIVQGKSYDLAVEPGLSLWRQIEAAVQGLEPETRWHDELRDSDQRRYGAPTSVRPRLGQGSFRILVTDAYDRRCAVTSERVLPVLEAAHIRPYARGGEHRVDNGLLLRSDLHTLFDRGYITVTPTLDLEVSHRIRDDFDNGRHYYELHGCAVRVPETRSDRPSTEFLSWHNSEVYLG